MRKYIFMLGVVMLALLLVSIEPSYGEINQEDTPVFKELNSNELFENIINENINIKKICTMDFCSELKGKNKKESVENFKQEYKEYLSKIVGEEEALSTILKGFPITKVE